MSSLPPIDAAAPQPPPAARTAEEAAALDAELQQLHDQLGVKRGARGIVLLLADDEAKLAPIARRAGFAVDGAGAFG